MGHFGNKGGYPTRSTFKETLRERVIVNIGAAGAPTLVAGAPQDWSFTRTGVGTYTMTFPGGMTQALHVPVLRGEVQLSAAKTVSKVIFTALDLSAGTASFTTALTSGTAADPASGDILTFSLEGSPYG